jgi:hypothetical protein
MPPFKDIIGMKFGRLIVLKLAYTKRASKTLYYYLCKCDCGKEHIVLKSSLLNGLTRSCGCYNNEIRAEQCKKRAKHNLTNTRLHSIWEKMNGRCYCKTQPDYMRYGGRGIAICDEWKNDFKSFYDWSMNNGYQDDLSIDRIDVNGNYEPSNCRWVDEKTQQRNRRNNRLITYNNETHCLFEWAEIFGINPKILSQRLNRDKMDFETAIHYTKK